MYIINIIKNVVYFILLIVCAYTDLKKGKIYNKYLLSFLFFYVVLSCIQYTLAIFTNNNYLSLLNVEFVNKFLGLILGFLIGFIFYILGVFKAGDSKLLALVGLYTGVDQVLKHFAVIIIVAGIVALYILVKNKILIERLKKVYLYVRGMILTKHFEKYKVANDDSIKFSFAIYVFIGEIISYIFL